MTQLGRISFGPLATSTLGFERFINDVEKWFDEVETKTTAYPPHNILKLEDNKYVVELAAAGFSKDDLDISFQDGLLVIKGTKEDKIPANKYLHKGLAARSFTKSIRIADTIEIRGAEFKDGILRIGLENVIPDHKKPKKIQIADSIEFVPTKQLLSE